MYEADMVSSTGKLTSFVKEIHHVIVKEIHHVKCMGESFPFFDGLLFFSQGSGSIFFLQKLTFANVLKATFCQGSFISSEKKPKKSGVKVPKIIVIRLFVFNDMQHFHKNGRREVTQIVCDMP